MRIDARGLFSIAARRLVPAVTGVIRAVRFAGALEGIEEGIESGLSTIRW
jgi:hypothetical protein